MLCGLQFIGKSFCGPQITRKGLKNELKLIEIGNLVTFWIVRGLHKYCIYGGPHAARGQCVWDPRVQFHHILHAAFAPTVLRQLITNLKRKHKKLHAKLTYVKAARRTLVKLTRGLIQIELGRGSREEAKPFRNNCFVFHRPKMKSFTFVSAWPGFEKQFFVCQS